MNPKLRHFLVSFVKSRRNRTHFLIRINKLYKQALKSEEWEDISEHKWTTMTRVHDKRRFLVKIDKFVRNLRSIEQLPLYVHELAYVWLSQMWEILVMGGGYGSVRETLTELQVPIPHYETKREEDPLSKTPVPRSLLINLLLDRIRVIYVSKVTIHHENAGMIRCNRVRPPLPGINGKLHGLSLDVFMAENRVLRLYGVIDRDSLRVYRNMIPKDAIVADIKTKYKIEREEALAHLSVFSLRDYLIHETRQITNKIHQQVERIKYYKRADVTTILNEFHFMPDEMRIQYTNLLLEFDLVSHVKYVVSKMAIPDIKWLDDVNRYKIKDFVRSGVKTTATAKEGPVDEDAPYELRISKMNTSKKIKDKAYEKLKSITRSSQGAAKAQKYLDGILKIPFGKIRQESDLNDPGRELMNECRAKFKNEVATDDIKRMGNNYIRIFDTLATSVNESCASFAKQARTKLVKSREGQRAYLQRVADILEENVHGHPLVKIKIRRLLAQWISGGQSGLILGLEGPPGNGKTTLIKHGLSKCIVDEKGEPRPVGFIPLGGTANSSFLVGHGYTYLGSTWGRIVDILMESECMNPILLFDELDKVSGTESGREIIGTLTHLTDTTQNDEFYDKYFEGVPLDLSKALLVFTFNDRSKIDPILLDRMTVIKTESLSLDDKLVVTRRHLIPQIVDFMNICPECIQVTDDQICNIIHEYTREAGARQLKKILEDLIQELNVRRLLDPAYELHITPELIEDVLEHRDKIRHETIVSKPTMVGQIYGMYANALGLGGVMPIQVGYHKEDKLLLTGQQGDVMQESMKCARTMARRILKRECPELYEAEDFSTGLHIHCPATSTPKDGPSAGGAICLAIFSYLSNRGLKTDVAMTGEIDLYGNITAIGGLEAKLNGAKRAGIHLALIPAENEEQLLRLRKRGTSAESEDFKVVMVSHINEAMKYIL